MDNKLIQALKKNEKPFGLMTDEMQEAALELTADKFWLYVGGDWIGQCMIAEEWNKGFKTAKTYRLLPSYEQEPEIEECEVRLTADGELGYMRDGFWCGLYYVTNKPDFIGFKYKDKRIKDGQRVVACARLYLAPDGFTCINGMEDNDEVLTPTHCLFKKSQ